LDVCHSPDLPLLTALCVNQAGVKTGKLNPSSLKGFVLGAKRLAHSVTDAEEIQRRARSNALIGGSHNLRRPAEVGHRQWARVLAALPERLLCHPERFRA
jgi:hypothetical protein